jgi:hypothetical protein
MEALVSFKPLLLYPVGKCSLYLFTMRLGALQNGLDAVKKRKISCLCMKLKNVCLVVPVAQCLYQLCNCG